VNVVAIYGSPRRGGNSDVMLDVFLSPVQPTDTIIRIIPSEMKFSQCKGCRACEKTGVCVIDDEIKTVSNHLLQADRVIISAPIFFYGFPSALKALIDRSQVLWSRKYLLKEDLKPKMGFLLAIGATQGKKLFEGVILTSRFYFDGFNCKYQGKVVFRGFDKKAEIKNCQACLEEIKKAAQKFFYSENTIK
jgi:multimeric flavodoxin WrbA